MSKEALTGSILDRQPTFLLLREPRGRPELSEMASEPKVPEKGTTVSLSPGMLFALLPVWSVLEMFYCYASNTKYIVLNGSLAI